MTFPRMDIPGGTLWMGDCLELMRHIPDGSVDMVVTDPPYRTISGGTSSKLASGWSTSVLHKNDGKIFNHNDVSIADYMGGINRVLRDGSQCYVMTNNLNLRELLNVAEAIGFKFHNLLTWRKNTCTANRWYMKEMELTCFFYKPPAKSINNMSSKQIFEWDNPRNKSHPTEKPVELMQHYIENSSQPSELILDPFCGAGASAIAAMRTNRRFICIEREPEYFLKSMGRIQSELPT